MTYVRSLEEVIMRTLRDYGIESGAGVRPDGRLGGERQDRRHRRARQPPGRRGRRLGDDARLALNVDVDLAWFERIVPCGIADRGVTSMERLLGDAPPLPEVAERLVAHFGEVFGREMLRRRETRLPRSAAV